MSFNELPLEIRVKIGRQYWKLMFVKSLSGAYGETDSPAGKNKTIRVRRRLKQDVLLDTIIHELLHASEWAAGEEWIDKLATNMSQVLILAGWSRRQIKSSTKQEQLIKLIHTCLRLAKPQLDYDHWADVAAQDIARVIWRLGWRCDPKFISEEK